MTTTFRCKYSWDADTANHGAMLTSKVDTCFTSRIYTTLEHIRTLVQLWSEHTCVLRSRAQFPSNSSTRYTVLDRHDSSPSSCHNFSTSGCRKVPSCREIVPVNCSSFALGILYSSRRCIQVELDLTVKLSLLVSKFATPWQRVLWSIC